MFTPYKPENVFLGRDYIFSNNERYGRSHLLRSFHMDLYSLGCLELVYNYGAQLFLLTIFELSKKQPGEVFTFV